MDMKSTQNKAELSIDHFLWLTVSWIWYYALLFRPLWKLSTGMSLLALLSSVIFCQITGICFRMQKSRNSVQSIADIVLGYGIYTSISYFPVGHRLILSVYIISAILGAVCSSRILFRKIRNRRKIRMIIRRRIKSALEVFRNIAFNFVICSNMIPSILFSYNCQYCTIRNRCDTLIVCARSTSYTRILF